jgi:predicted permease
VTAPDSIARLLGSVRRALTERRLDEEIRFHVDMQTAKNERLGMGADEARRRALIAFGGRERCKELVRDDVRHRPFENALQDLRYSARALLSAPAYTLAAVLALGIGIGAVTGVFTLLDAVVLRPLPYAQPDRLVMMFETNGEKDLTHEQLSPVNFVDYRGMTDIFADAAAWWRPEINLTDDENGDAIRVSAVETTWNLFRVLGVRPSIGSGFTADSALYGKSNEVVISHRLWQTRFSGKPTIVGEAVRMNGEEYTIAGIMPPGFDFPGKTDAWQMLTWDLTKHSRGAHFMGDVARLKPNVSTERANGALAGLTSRLESEFRGTNLGWRARVVPLDREIEGTFRPALFALLAASALLLVIACINVANLMLARCLARSREVAVRCAVGASRQRIVSLFLAESVLLAAGGAVVGCAVAALSVKGLLAWSPVAIPRVDVVSIDVRVLLVSLSAALITTLVFGLGPALHISRASPGEAVRDGAKGSQREGTMTRGLLVVAQVALAVVLLSGAGLLIRSVSKLLRQDVGLDTSGVLTGDVQLPASSGRARMPWAGILRQSRATSARSARAW